MTSVLEWFFVLWMNGTVVLWVAAGFIIGRPFWKAWAYSRRHSLDTYFISGAILLASLNTAEAAFFALVVDIRFVDFGDADALALAAVHFIPLTLTLQAVAYLMMGGAALEKVEETHARIAQPDAGGERA